MALLAVSAQNRTTIKRSAGTYDATIAHAQPAAIARFAGLGPFERFDPVSEISTKSSLVYVEPRRERRARFAGGIVVREPALRGASV